MYTFKILLESTDADKPQKRFKEAIYQTNLMLGFSTKKNLRQYVLNEINKQLKADQDLNWQAVGIIDIEETAEQRELPNTFTKCLTRSLASSDVATREAIYREIYNNQIWENGIS